MQGIIYKNSPRMGATSSSTHEPVSTRFKKYKKHNKKAFTTLLEDLACKTADSIRINVTSK